MISQPLAKHSYRAFQYTRQRITLLSEQTRRVIPDSRQRDYAADWHHEKHLFFGIGPFAPRSRVRSFFVYTSFRTSLLFKKSHTPIPWDEKLNADLRQSRCSEQCPGTKPSTHQAIRIRPGWCRREPFHSFDHAKTPQSRRTRKERDCHRHPNLRGVSSTPRSKKILD